ISIFTHEPVDRPPTEAEMASMGKLIEEGMKAGWLIATEGVHFGATGVRVHKSAGGKVTVTDGPFAETKESSAATRCSKLRPRMRRWNSRGVSSTKSVRERVRFTGFTRCRPENRSPANLAWVSAVDSRSHTLVSWLAGPRRSRLAPMIQ